MNKAVVSSWLGAILVLGLSVISMMLGMMLLPSRQAAVEADSLAPWVLAWGMVLMSVLLAMALAGYLVVLGMSRYGARQA